MEKTTSPVAARSSSSSSSGSSMSSFDYLFGPKPSASSSSSSSSSSGIFSSIFPPPPLVPDGERKHDFEYEAEITGKYANPDNSTKASKSGSKDVSSMYQSSEPCYFSSSIHYGGQENYSPRTQPTTEFHHTFKKDGSDDGGNGSNSNSASRGNWWKGSLYY